MNEQNNLQQDNEQENESVQESVQTSEGEAQTAREQTAEGKVAKTPFKNRFTPKRIALMAVFAALAFAVSLGSIPLFPATPVFFLELDFGNVLILLIGFLLGPIEGIIVCVLKECVRLLAGSTLGVGELANMLMTTAFILYPAIVYQYKKGVKSVLFSLLVACVVGTAAAHLVNRFITFPLFGEVFLHTDGVALFYGSFWLILAFNAIKTVAISIVTLLLYKRLSNFLRKWKI